MPMQHQETNRKNDLLVMLMALGNAYLDKGLYGKAAERYQQILKFNVTNKSLLINLSRAFIGLKRFDTYALDIYQKAIQYDPDNTRLATVLAMTCMNQGREDADALKIYEAAMRHQNEIFDKLAEYVGGVYYKKRDFNNSKRVTENLLQKVGFHRKALSIFVQSCWNTGRYDDANSQLKKLLHMSDHKAPIIQSLCLTMLEKRFAGELNNLLTQFSAADRQIINAHLAKAATINSLQEMSQYLELKRFVCNKNNWEGLVQSSIEEFELSLVGQVAEGAAESSQMPAAANPSGFSFANDFLAKLSRFEMNADAGSEGRSQLTYEDFKNEGMAVFADRNDLKLPEGVDVLVTVEISNYSQLFETFGPDRIDEIKNKLYVILGELLRKYQLRHIWTTSNGLLIFSDDLFACVSFSIGILSKLNRYNFLTDEHEKFHLSIGIHHAKETFGEDGEQTLKDLSIGLKLGIAAEKHLPLNAEPRLANALQKTDRVLVTSKAFRQIKSSNKFNVNNVGQTKVKYLSEALSIHEIAWRSPLEDLAFGHIRKLGRFDLLAELDNRGFFRVYKAKDTTLQRLVILKAIQAEDFIALPDNNPRKNAFYQLANTLARMNHPNIATIYEVDEDQGLTYFVRELIEGAPVTDLFKSLSQFNPTRFMQILNQVCKALHYGHQLGYYHLNLKPTNIWVGFYDETKVLDFHLPESILGEEASASGKFDGITYKSPEQLLGGQGDSRSDIFAVGAIFYETATGIKPFDGTDPERVKAAVVQKKIQPPSEFNKNVPEFCDQIIMKCLEKKPHDRFQSVDEMLVLLKQAFEQGVFSNYNSQIAQSRNSY